MVDGHMAKVRAGKRGQALSGFVFQHVHYFFGAQRPHCHGPRPGDPGVGYAFPGGTGR
jgi:hypothetical protein